MTTDSENNIVDPVDIQIGGDGDFGGIARTLTEADIDAILYSAQPLEKRREQLRILQQELKARISADRGGDFDALLSSVDAALSTLDSDGSETGVRLSVGMDRSVRGDVHSPENKIGTSQPEDD